MFLFGNTEFDEPINGHNANILGMLAIQTWNGHQYVHVEYLFPDKYSIPVIYNFLEHQFVVYSGNVLLIKAYMYMLWCTNFATLNINLCNII